MDRHTFLRGTGGLVLLWISGCGGGGGDEGGSTPSLPSGSGCQAESITLNHGHTLSIPEADLKSTESKTYAIDGASGHSHTITLTKEQLAALAAKQRVTVPSTNAADGHSHSVTVVCL